MYGSIIIESWTDAVGEILCVYLNWIELKVIFPVSEGLVSSPSNLNSS